MNICTIPWIMPAAILAGVLVFIVLSAVVFIGTDMTLFRSRVKKEGKKK